MTRYWPVLLLVAAATISACGGDDAQTPSDPITNVSSESRGPVAAAQEVEAADFPKPERGESIDELAAQFDASGPMAVAGTSVYRTPGGRIAFGLLDEDFKFQYGPTVVYVAPYEGGRVEGPFPAPADVLVTDAKFRSAQAATEDDSFAAIYESEVTFDKPGIYKILTVSDIDGTRFAAGLNAEVIAPDEDPVPDVGEKAPVVETDTRASVKGDLDLLDTREPQALELHEQSFADVVGKEPVVLLFSTPQLCRSRVCGPVTDELLQVKSEVGDKAAFIHQETYAGNDINKGFREPLIKYGLPSEPWLFTVDRDGKIAARLEGSFGLRAFRDAVDAAL